MRAAVAVLLALVFSAPAAATVRFDDPPTEPAAPTASHAIDARLIVPIACVEPVFEVVRQDPVVDLRYLPPVIDCPVVPTDMPRTVAIGTLPAGIYHLRVSNMLSGSPLPDDQVTITVAPSSGTPAPARFASPAVSPQPPLAGEPAEVRVLIDAGCEPPAFTVSRILGDEGPVIDVRYRRSPFECASIPIETLVELPLEPLAAGRYDLLLVDATDEAHPHVDDQEVFTVQERPCATASGGQLTGLCLQGGRFSVTAQWNAHDGSAGNGHPVPLTRDTGSFWFFGRDNLELMVKVLDACALYGRFWLYASGLTDVDVVLTVRDVGSGTVRTYHRARGSLFAPLADTSSFGCGTF